jgi:hypothetical protein
MRTPRAGRAPIVAFAVFLCVAGTGPLIGAAVQDQPAPASSVPATDSSPVREAETVRSTVDDVLSAPEYRHLVRPKPEEESEPKLPKWLERLLDWLFGGDTEVRAPNLSVLGMLLRGFMYLIAVAILVLVAILIVRSVVQYLPNRSNKQPGLVALDALAPATPPGELPADEYVRRALELSRAGDHKAAIRQLLLGTMSWIERAGLIRFRKGLTNRDYLRAIWRRPACRDSMAAITDVFDRVYFGRRTATPEAFERCLEQYQTGFTGNEATSMAS